MREIRLSSEAEAELDAIWFYIARESGSIDVANRVIDRITDRFWLLAQYPYLGRSREGDLGPSLRSLTADEYVVIYRLDLNGVVLILHIVHGNRDITSLLARD